MSEEKITQEKRKHKIDSKIASLSKSSDPKVTIHPKPKENPNINPQSGQQPP